MSKLKGSRFLCALMVCVLMLSCFTMSAFAYADDTEQELPVTEATLPEDMPEGDTEQAEQTEPEVTAGESFADDGNAVTRDLLYDKATNKQFITVQTKNGNTFYIIIDYDKPLDEDGEAYETYFLNLVDERDLTDLLDEEDIVVPVCTCSDKCVAGDVDTTCPVCKNNMSECTGIEKEPEVPADDSAVEQDEPEQKQSNLSTIVLVIVIVIVAGGIYYYVKFVRNKKPQDEDFDFFDDDGYEEGPYINEDAEPQIAQDEDETEDDQD